MARLEQSVQNIVDMFVKHANSDCKLNKVEFKKLVETEVQCPEMKAKLCAADCDMIFGRMDKNNDGDIDFKEFLHCVAFMCKCCYHKKTGKGEPCDQRRNK